MWLLDYVIKKILYTLHIPQTNYHKPLKAPKPSIRTIGTDLNALLKIKYLLPYLVNINKNPNFTHAANLI